MLEFQRHISYEGINHVEVKIIRAKRSRAQNKRTKVVRALQSYVAREIGVLHL